MANAILSDPVVPIDSNVSNFTMLQTLDAPTFFADLGFDDEDGDFEFNLDDLSIPSDTEPFVVGDFDFIDELGGDRIGVGKDSNLNVSVDCGGGNAGGNNLNVFDIVSDDVHVGEGENENESPKETYLGDGDRINGISVDSNSTVSNVDINVGENIGILDFDEFGNLMDVSVGDEKVGPQCEGVNGEGLSNDSPSYEGNGPASSHGSGTCGVGYEGVIYSSPEAVSRCDKDVEGSIVECEMGKEVLGKRSLSGRIEECGQGRIEQSSNKVRRFSEKSDKCVSPGNEDDEKRKARMMRNRESAQLSRQRKKQYVDELEEKIRVMHSTITDLNNRISFVMAENNSLRHQLCGGGMYPPPPGMYPQMPYPWTPYPPYAAKPQGSQVPLVPIPRLKPRQPSKSKSSTKKVASISLLGLLFFIFLFGALVPLMNLQYDGSGPHRNQHKDRILNINGHRDASEYMLAPASSERLSIHGNHQHNEKHQKPLKSENSSEPLAVSLYVPRNDKLLKIDGNLIIHSFLASEKTVSSYKTSENINDEKLGTAIVSHSEARSKHRNPTERRRALESGTESSSAKRGKPVLGETRFHQWFHEGLAGPMLTSGMCTEVFQFDISPMENPGAIIPASMVNSSINSQYNATRIRQIRNRRALNSLPIPDSNSSPNDTKGYLGKELPGDLLQANKTPSTMVVSVLADPREVGDMDNHIEPKTFSRIFVVVLLDSVKYVTYSCMLPTRGLGS